MGREHAAWFKLIESTTIRKQQAAFACTTGLTLTLVPATTGVIGSEAARVSGLFCVDGCLGGSSGAGFGWQPIDVWKIGVQYQINDRWQVRAGYNHTDNPIGPADVTFNILAPGVVKDQYSLGVTYRDSKEHEFTFAAMYAAHNEVTGQSLFTGFGLPPTTTETIGMKEYLLGAAYSFKF